MMNFIIEFLGAVVCELEGWFNKNDFVHGLGLIGDEKN